MKDKILLKVRQRLQMLHWFAMYAGILLWNAKFSCFFFDHLPAEFPINNRFTARGEGLWFGCEPLYWLRWLLSRSHLRFTSLQCEPGLARVASEQSLGGGVTQESGWKNPDKIIMMIFFQTRAMTEAFNRESPASVPLQRYRSRHSQHGSAGRQRTSDCSSSRRSWWHFKNSAKKKKKTSAHCSSIIKSKFVDMLRNIRNLTEQGGHAGSGIRDAPSCNKCMLYRPYEVLMRPCLMRSECLATAARIRSVSDQSNKIPGDEEGRLGGESQEWSCGRNRV